MRVEAIGPDFAPRLRDGVTLIPVEDEAILYEEGSGTLHQLNPTAAALCQLFDGEVRLHTLIEDAVAVFEADRATVEADVLDLARELGGKGLLDGIEPGGQETPPQRGASN